MTTDKARKRAVRQRMARTGERYAAARRHVAPPGAPGAPASAEGSTPHDGPAAGDPAAAAGGPARDGVEAAPATPSTGEPASTGTRPGAAPLPPRAAEPEVSEAAVRRATDRGWDDWLRILDARGVDGFSHRATAAWLAAEHGLSGWWAQTVTVGFERARGLRRVYEQADGFRVGVSRTLPASVDRLEAAFTDPTEQARWLEPGVLVLRGRSPAGTLRFDVRDSRSRVAVAFASRSPTRTTVSVEASRLEKAAEVESARSTWAERLAVLRGILARPGPDG